MESYLKIVIDETGKAKVNFSGDLSKISRAIIHLARKEEELAAALNTGIIALRDEMVGIINNTVKK